MTSAGSLIVLLVATIAGGVAGLVLGGIGVGEFALALMAGFLGVMAAAVARNLILVQMGRGRSLGGIPGRIIGFSAIASLAGGMSAHEIILHVPGLPHGLLGALAGLLSALLMIMLVVAYYLNPGRRIG